MSVRRDAHHRKPVICPGCLKALAFIRPEWLILRRLLITDRVVRQDKIGGAVKLTCECGRVTVVEWNVIQF